MGDLSPAIPRCCAKKPDAYATVSPDFAQARHPQNLYYQQVS